MVRVRFRLVQKEVPGHQSRPTNPVKQEPVKKCFMSSHRERPKEWSQALIMFIVDKVREVRQASLSLAPGQAFQTMQGRHDDALNKDAPL